MAEFFNINSDDEHLNIAPIILSSIPVINSNSEIIIGNKLIVPNVELVEEENLYEIVKFANVIDSPEEINSCPNCCESLTRDNTKEEYFKIENYFSELTSEYQRTLIRYNLGISDLYSLVWGNIKGNLANQSDLYNFIINTIASDLNITIDEVNTKLAQWAYDIRILLSEKANLYSPDLIGSPTTSLPSDSDNSTRIASTEWVNARLAETSNFALDWFTLNQTSMLNGDSPVNLICTWQYNNAVDSQSINGITIANNIRTYTFNNINSSLIIKLLYTINNITYNKVITFNKLIPIYFGSELNYNNLNKTSDKFVTINCGNDKYAYIYIPNGENAKLSVNGMIGGFRNIGSATISGIVYYIYRSVNLGLGELTINIL